MTNCRIQKSSRICLRLRMDSISGDSHVIPTSFPRSKSCVDSIYEAHRAEVRYRIISKRWACVIMNCMHQVWDDFGSGWVIFSKNGSFEFRDSTVFHRRFPSMRLLCTIAICIHSAMSAIGLDCIWLGCCGLDSVVFHSGLKAMSSSVFP